MPLPRGNLCLFLSHFHPVFVFLASSLSFSAFYEAGNVGLPCLTTDTLFAFCWRNSCRGLPTERVHSRNIVPVLRVSPLTAPLGRAVIVTSETFPRLSLCVWDANHQNKCGRASEPGLRRKKKVDQDKLPLLTFTSPTAVWYSLSKPSLRSRAVVWVMLLCLLVGSTLQLSDLLKMLSDLREVKHLLCKSVRLTHLFDFFF